MRETMRAYGNGLDLRFRKEHYDRLKQCSANGEEGIKEWNEWRRQNPSIDICLDRADLRGCDLKDANLMHGSVDFMTEDETVEFSGEVYLREAKLEDLKGRRTRFSRAHLERTWWTWAKLEECDFASAHLTEAQLDVCDLDRCDFSDAILRNVSFTASSLRGAKLMHSDLRGCSARGVITDGATIIWECLVDKETDFTGVGLDGIRIDPGTKQALEHAVRRINWERWYRVGKPDYAFPRETRREQQQRKVRETCRCVLTSPVRLFWMFSDYGKSTGRIVAAFVILSLLFAAIYANLACWFPPGVVSNLQVERHLPLWHYFLLLIARPVYFSVVTMTTLGFGDMYANAMSIWGHILLVVQVLLGYLLLGALVTRFAVLFSAGGPAGRFAEGGDRSEDREEAS